MKKSMAGVCAAVLLATLGGGGNAWSQETGIAEIHTWVKVGRKMHGRSFCDGSGNGGARAGRARRRACGSPTALGVWRNPGNATARGEQEQ
jgi:hypothetical protein